MRLLAFIVPEKSLTKNLTLAYIERKKNERTIEQISRESPLSLKRYKSSSLLHCIPSLRLLAFIVPEKSLTKNLTLAFRDRRNNERTIEQISRESPLSLKRYKSSSLLHCIPSLRLLAFIVPEKSLTKNLTLAYIERRKNERTIEQISRESPLSLKRYKSSSLLHCIPSLRLLAFIVPEKSLTKNLTLAYRDRKEE